MNLRTCCFKHIIHIFCRQCNAEYGFFIEIVGFFSRTIGFTDSLYAAVGMFHGKQLPQTGHWTKGVPERYVSRETYVSQGAFSLCAAALFDCKKTPHKATFTESGIKTEII